MSTGFIGRYEVTGVLGRGGMGEVLAGRDPDSGDAVAIKRVLPEVLDARGLKRFIREANVLVGLEHPSLIRVRDTGIDGAGRAFLVMDLVPGGSLQDRIDRDGRLPPDEAASIVASVARALAVVHARGILHRDLKPDNVLLPEGGAPVLTDFGLAGTLEGGAPDDASTLAAHTAPGTPITLDGVFIGTAGYCSPEQATGSTDRIGETSDVYGLGATLYAALTGRQPFTGPNLTVLLRAQLMSPLAPPSKTAPEVPTWLDDLCERCLAPEPGDRFPSAKLVAGALELRDVRANGDRAPGRSERGIRADARRATRIADVGAAALLSLVIVVSAVVLWIWTQASDRVVAGDGSAPSLDEDPDPDASGESPALATGRPKGRPGANRGLRMGAVYATGHGRFRVTSGELPDGWRLPDFDDSSWPLAERSMSVAGSHAAVYGYDGSAESAAGVHLGVASVARRVWAGRAARVRFTVPSTVDRAELLIAASRATIAVDGKKVTEWAVALRDYRGSARVIDVRPWIVPGGEHAIAIETPGGRFAAELRLNGPAFVPPVTDSPDALEVTFAEIPGDLTRFQRFDSTVEMARSDLVGFETVATLVSLRDATFGDAASVVDRIRRGFEVAGDDSVSCARVVAAVGLLEVGEVRSEIRSALRRFPDRRAGTLAAAALERIGSSDDVLLLRAALSDPDANAATRRAARRALFRLRESFPAASAVPADDRSK